MREEIRLIDGVLFFHGRGYDLATFDGYNREAKDKFVLLRGTLPTELPVESAQEAEKLESLCTQHFQGS
jgi:hypothetical protein